MAVEASKGDQKVQKSTNFFFIVHGIWGAQNDRTVVGSIFGYQDDTPKCLFFYILGGFRVKKGSKRVKNHQKKSFLYVKHGVSNRMVI